VPAGGKVDRAIKHVMASAGVPKGRAIAILKAQGTIRQRGKHLASGKGRGK